MKLCGEIEAAPKKIQKIILRTPMIYSDTVSKLTGKEVFLKLENLQKTGFFKIREAYYKLFQRDVGRGSQAARRGLRPRRIALVVKAMMRATFFYRL